MALRLRVSREVVSKNIRDGRKSVTCLICWHVVNVGSIGELGWSVLDMSGQGVRVVHASEGLTQRRGLDDPLAGKVLVRGGDDGESWRSLISAGHAWGLGGKAIRVSVFVHTVALGRLLLQPRLDDVPLLVAN